MTARAPGRLVWRLYAVGIVQLAMVIVAALLIWMAVTRLPARVDLPSESARLQRLIGQPAALAHALEEQRARQLLISLYDPDLQLMASNVEPPLPAPRWRTGPDATEVGVPADRSDRGPPPHYREQGGPHDRQPGPGLFDWPPYLRPHPPGIEAGPDHGPPPLLLYTRMPMNGREGLLVAQLHRPKPSIVPPLLTFVCGLLVVFVGALLTARWIARPLEQLAAAARALGAGDLRARAEMKRTDELGEVGQAFDDMAARIQSLLTAEKELLANVAHELRTPVARIRVALEIAAEEDPAAVHRSLAEIALDLSELELLIDDVLTTVRFAIAEGDEQGSSLPLHLQIMPASAIAEQAAARFRQRHPERVLALDCAGMTDPIEVDPVLFRRAIDNLLDNAHKYTPQVEQPVGLRVTRRGERVFFEVSDQGIGIGPEDLPRIFTPFFRAERSRSRGTGGVGLGLTLTKRIVESHHGAVEVQSRLGLGTLTTLSVPVAS
jgi:two-component system OmpR family sensor kinase